ncbi:MAG: UDP-galactopyranose mutase [Acholeplasmatales bacterium]|jgi:UDP-galactopyranose mutase|nr:UDP-galactopyranose mutase [Acholeplasmatales bacterium]
MQENILKEKEYDFIIVGAGLFGSSFAYLANQKGYKTLIIEKNDHIGGNLFTYEESGINVHKYGAHIFHTNNKKVYDFLIKFSPLNNYINSPMAIYKDEIYNLPFNMNTFSKLWGIKTPQEAKRIIDDQIKNSGITNPKNLKEQAISLVGTDIYEKLIKDYTEKQWGRSCEELDPSIIKRLPVRFTYDNNYFNDAYQGIPTLGYTKIIEKMIKDSDILLNTDYLTIKDTLNISPKIKIIYTGMIDEYFNYSLGNLEYRTLKFETEKISINNFQGNAVINYTSSAEKYTRIIEHKHFNKDSYDKDITIITKEYSDTYVKGKIPYYPINNDLNNSLYEKYLALNKNENLYFAGRLGYYKYMDMDKIIEKAMELAENLL